MSFHAPPANFADAAPVAIDLRRPGSEKIAIAGDRSTAMAITLFQTHRNLQILPVLDAGSRPIGALFERDIREILYNPYGHALLQNPSFGGMVRDRVSACPMAEADADMAALLAIQAAAAESEGVILTHNGCYCGVIEPQGLVRAAALDQEARFRRRELELEAAARAGAAFEADIGGIVADLARLSDALGQRSAQTAERGRSTGRRGIEVAAAAEQASQSLATVAARGGEMVGALGRLHRETIGVRKQAAEADQLVTAGSARAGSLFASAVAIDEVTGLVDALAARVRMLAINATIEAARAGEAGRSFAVVAAEVRALADQTKTAAARIRGHTGEVQAAAREVVEGQGGIALVVAGLARISASVDHTVEAQHALMRGIAEGVAQASVMSSDVQRNVAAIGDAASAAAADAVDMQAMAAALADASTHILDRARGFVDEAR